MKRNSWIILLIVSLLANDSLALDQMFHPDSVLRQDPRSSTTLIEEGEILIRFGDDVLLNITKTNDVYKTGLDAVDEILKNANIIHIAPLFNGAKRKFNKEYIKTFAGQEIEIPNLHHIYRIKTGEQTYELFQLIEQLKLQKEVVYAEPNYIQSLTSIVPAGQVMTADEVEAYFEKDGKHTKQTDAFVPNDPLYGQQWYIPAVKADLVWDSINGKDTTQVIAILDTGVDWLHPDLQNKIWQNAEEIPDNGVDDDGNGKVDDVRGWDWINNDNNPTDDNSHGTHVAGIAAAQQNNSIGISGVSPGAKIMALKVFQSSGRGNTADITEGIIYATQKGATVINMSFGTYARSFVMEDALVNAYATVILVAAAGNDGVYVEQCIPSSPFYPAALSYVLGVQAPDGSFSNTDCNGPTYSNHAELFNYEMKAPGTGIISTIPNGNYRAYQGTSMAAPILSGALAMYKPLRTTESMELMWVKLIQSTGTYINIFDALNKIPVAEVRMLSKTLIDTMPGCDEDGRVDAGETIKLWFTARNTGNSCDSTWFKIRFHEFEDTTTATIVKSTSYIGSMSPYATRTSENDPMVIAINTNVAHDRDISFDLLSWYRGSIDTLIQNVIMTIENGEELGGIMDTTLTLTPDKLWLVSESFRVGINGTLIIKPGTKIIIYPGKQIQVRGNIQAIGTADSIIYFSPKNDMGGQGIDEQNNNATSPSYFKYCQFDNFIEPLRGSSFHISNSNFNNLHLMYYVGTFINNKCMFYGSSSNQRFYGFISMLKNNFVDKTPDSYGSPPIFSLSNSKFNNFINISIPALYASINDQNSWYNSFIKTNGTIFYGHPYTPDDFIYIPNQYLGTIDSLRLESLKYDFIDNPQSPFIIFDPLLLSPPDSCHAIVWKVLVNGKDAQDEYVEPVGVGTQRFDVYFNREMDTIFTPQLTFGVRYPYTQQSVADSARWDSSHRIFTAFKTIQLYTGDGINRIRVAGAREANGWQWDIPVEDMRFEFLIDAAGSASTDFTATPGIGKVNLEWFEPDDLPTLLGYNMYRFHHLTDTTFSDTTMVNSSLVNDTLFTDFNVNPLQKYYYMYKIVRTDFTESDFSKVVNATVLTASPGDANGDQSVNILDITTIVGYILNQNPQPFLLEAADVNDDGSINLLDIIGVVNLVMGGKAPGVKSNPALAYLEPGQILFESDGTLTGFQFQLIGTDVEQLSISPAIAGFEFVKFLEGDTLNCILFSLNNQLIPAGRLKLFNLSSQNQMPDWGILFAGNAQGDYVPVNKSITSLPEDYRYDFKVYPNPGNGLFTIEIESPETAAVQILLFDKLGRQVFNTERQSVLKGLTSITLDPRNSISSEGLHFLIFQYGKQGESGLKYRKVKKLLIIR